MEFTRVKIKLSKTEQLVPYDNQSKVNGIVHRWLGENNKWHDGQSNYNVSTLLGGNGTKDGLVFPNGGFLVVSSIDREFTETLLRGVMRNRHFGFGMKAESIAPITEGFNNKFICLSPILVRTQEIGEKRKYYTFEDKDCFEVLTQKMKNRLEKVSPGVDLQNYKIVPSVKPKHKKQQKKKLITVGETHNVCFLSHLLVVGSPEAVALSYHLGLGDSTGSGFGMIARSHEVYYDA